MKTLNLAVIGKDVSKSSSPQIHKFIAENMGNSITYDKVSLPENSAFLPEELFKKYDGFNVTIPYKLTIIPYLEKVSGDAQTFGAVNTVTTADKAGYNTDGLGFMLMLKNNGVQVAGKKVLLLGAGGAGRSVAKKLADAGAEVCVYDKFYENCLKVANEFNVTALKEIQLKEYYLIINATGIGMHATEGLSPVGQELVSLCTVAVDLIYTPAKSAFLQIAESFGKKIINGEAMLFYQAYYAECIYFGLTPDEEQAKALFKKYSEVSL